MKAGRRKPFHALAVLVFCLAVIAASGTAGYLYFAAEKRSFDAQARNQLAAIAEMKLRQISAWRAERLGDASALQSNPFIVPAVLKRLNGGRNQGEIETWMEQLLGAYGYTAASLWDANCRRRVGLPANHRADTVESEFIREAIRNRTPLLTDLHRDEPNGAVHIELVVPLQISSFSEPIGALLLEIDPEIFLLSPHPNVADAQPVGGDLARPPRRGRSRVLERAAAPEGHRAQTPVSSQRQQTCRGMGRARTRRA